MQQVSKRIEKMQPSATLEMAQKSRELKQQGIDIISLSLGEPDFVIGPKDDPYLHRWWITPRTGKGAVYLHEMFKPDDDRALHDHPWESLSICLSGGMTEYMTNGESREVSKGDIIWRGSTYAHRLGQPKPNTRTLFITGERMRTWGFHCPKGWVRWRDFVAENPGEIGRGCGEMS